MYLTGRLVARMFKRHLVPFLVFSMISACSLRVLKRSTTLREAAQMLYERGFYQQIAYSLPLISSHVNITEGSEPTITNGRLLLEINRHSDIYDVSGCRDRWLEEIKGTECRRQT